MSNWEIISEEASIVLVGNMNPKIFQPEWFIRKGIVEEWDYSQDEFISLPDMSQMELPNDRKLTALFNQFSIRSSRASEYFSLKDLVMSTFTLLSETPILQMGMNYTSAIKIVNQDKWRQFGSQLAPQNYWKNAANFINSLEEDKQKELGLWELTMNLPRPDNLKGFIRPKIAVLQTDANTLIFSINNHVEIEGSSAATMTKILGENWDKSLFLAKEITLNIMESQLGAEK
jgi:hypothetical protein